MHRPCFLVVDREFPGGISTRKLVIETAKLNVLSAYSGEEARELFRRFPAVDGLVLDSGLEDVPCEDLVKEFKAQHADLPIVVISSPGDGECPGADVMVESFEPDRLLEALRRLHPREAEAIERRNEELSRKHLR